MKKSIPFRSSFYFVSGYGYYYAFIVAIANMFTLTYYLIVDKNQTLDFIFPSFTFYVIITSAIVFPLLILLGFLHYKRSRAFISDTEIIQESNPYNYKLMPGIHSEALAPLLLELLKLSRKSFSLDKLTVDEILQLEKLEKKLEHLAEGNMFEIPKNFDGI